jgi:hypothetical protein
VAQTLYTHVSKYKNDKIKERKKINKKQSAKRSSRKYNYQDHICISQYNFKICKGVIERPSNGEKQIKQVTVHIDINILQKLLEYSGESDWLMAEFGKFTRHKINLKIRAGGVAPAGKSACLARVSF